MNDDRELTVREQKRRVLRFWRDVNYVAPATGVKDAPLQYICFNQEWSPIILGWLGWLTSVAAWQDAESEDYSGILGILDVLSLDCGVIMDIRINECNLEALIDGVWVDKGSIIDCVTPLTDDLQDQINTINLTLYQNSLARQTLQAQIASNDDDIDTINGQISSLALGQQSLQAQISANDTDILNINSYNATQQDELDDHETRITTLENTGSGSGSGTIKPTAYTIELSSAINGGGAFSQALSFSHEFTYPNAMIIVEMKMANLTSGQVAKIRCRLNDGVSDVLVGGNEAWVFSTSSEQFASTQLNQVFEGFTPQSLDVAIDLGSDSGTARIQAFQKIQILIVEYGEVAQTPISTDTVTFDDGSLPYTLPSPQDGTIQAVGHPDNCLAGPTQFPSWIEVQIDLGAVYQINGVFIDYYTEDAANSTARLFIDDVTMTPQGLAANSSWVSNLAIGYQDLPVNGQVIRVRLTKDTTGLIDMRLDNVFIDYQ